MLETFGNLAIWILVAVAVGGGMIGATIRTWSILARLYALENEVAVLERTTTSQVKRSAALERGRKDPMDTLAEQLKASPGVNAAVAPPQNPWFARFVHPDLQKKR